jgi:hypothetical protein
MDSNDTVIVYKTGREKIKKKFCIFFYEREIWKRENPARVSSLLKKRNSIKRRKFQVFRVMMGNRQLAPKKYIDNSIKIKKFYPDELIELKVLMDYVKLMLSLRRGGERNGHQSTS